MTEPQAADRFRILAVCTGNVFRSRIAEHYLRVGLAERLGPAAARFEVSSAGSSVASGRAVHPLEAAGLTRIGLPPDARPSQRLAASHIEAADLVLCAEQSHRAAVLDLVPAAMRRTFLIREFARVGAPSLQLADPSAVASADPVARAHEVVAAAAAFRGYVEAADRDDIADPWGEPEYVLTSAATLVRDAVPIVLDVLVGGPS